MTQLIKNLIGASIGVGVIFLICATIVPSLLYKQTTNSINQRIALTQATYDRWGQIPGHYNIQATKSYKLFNITSNSSELFNGIVNLQELGPYTYAYTYSFLNVSYQPNTNDSIAFQRIFNLTPKSDFNLSNLSVTIPNLGALKSIQNYFNVSKYEITAQVLSQSVSEIGVDCILNLAAYYAFYFYTNNQTLVNNTIFTNNYANLTDSQKYSVWNDEDYGWKNYTGLQYWILPYFSGLNTNHPMWAYLQSRFNLTSQQMVALAGMNSILNEFRMLFGAYLKDTLGCPTDPCASDLLHSLQWSNASVSQLGFFNAPKIKSCSAFNRSLPGSPEIAEFGAGLFTTAQVKRLFAFDNVQNTFSSDPTSLINPNTLSFIDTAGGNIGAIRTRLQLTSDAQATAILSYIEQIFATYTFVDRALTTDPAAIRGIRLLKKYLQKSVLQTSSSLLLNLTSIPVYNWTYSTNNWTSCQSFFNGTKASGLSVCACTNPVFPDPSTLDGQGWYVNGYLSLKAKVAWDGQAAFFTYCAQNISDFFTLMQAPNEWNNYITQVQQNLTQTSFNCPYDCGLYQWATGGVTANLPPTYYSKNYSSLYEIYPNYFSKRQVIAEFYGYAKLKLNTTVTLTTDQVKRLFYDPGVGTFVNIYEFVRLIAATLKGDQAYVDTRFNKTGIAQYATQFVSYLRYLIYGSYISVTRDLTADQFLWGYTDTTMSDMVIGTPIEGFNPYLNNVISFVGPQSNMDQYSNNKSLLSTMNTGTTNYSKVRAFTSYRTSPTVGLVLDKYFDGSKLYTNYKLNPWQITQQITGTDGIAFPPPLKNQDLYYYNEPLYRNLKLAYNSTEYSGQYELVNYQIADSELNVNPNFLTNQAGFVNLSFVKDGPFVASYPYYLDCVNSTFDNLRINNQTIKQLQDTKANRTNFKLEKLTGFTVDRAEYIQYSVQIKFNSFWAAEFANPVITIPLMIEETRITSVESRYAEDLDVSMKEIKNKNALMIASIVLSILAFLTAIGLCIFQKKQNSKNEDSAYVQVDNEVDKH